MKQTRTVVVTGLSGSGRSAALKAFEDMGFYCVDNLPLVLLSAFVEFAQGAEDVLCSAIGIDIREKGFPERLPALYSSLKAGGRAIEILFLDASDQTLVRRFSESRRPHPLALGRSALEGIRAERERLAHLKAKADLVIDTSSFTVHEFRKLLATSFLDLPSPQRTLLSLVSFGYKYGLPVDADLIFDARCLPNPHFIDALRPLTGREPQVVEYVLGFAQAREFLTRIQEFLRFTLPLYVQEGKAYLTIAVGCTGGRHRSVVLIDGLARLLREVGHEVSVRHRDVDRIP